MGLAYELPNEIIPCSARYQMARAWRTAKESADTSTDSCISGERMDVATAAALASGATPIAQTIYRHDDSALVFEGEKKRRGYRSKVSKLRELPALWR